MGVLAMMNVASHQWTQAALILALAVLAPACGGGGGGGGGEGGGSGSGSSVFGGDYHRISFSGQNTLNIGRSGTSIFSGGVDYLEASISNTNGTIDSQVSAGTFALPGGGAFTWTTSGGFSFSGGVLSGGSMAISAAATNGGFPTILVDVRKGPCTDATFSGTYFISGYGFAPTGPSNYSFTGLLTADGAQGWSITATLNQNGTISSGVTNSGAYFVESDGSVTMIDVNGQVLNGGLMAGGDILVTSATSSGGPSEVTVGVRKGGAFSTGSMQGAYRAVSFGSSPGVAASHFSISQTATFDGLGGLTWTGTRNLEGTLGSITPVTETYAVAADGSLTINNAGGGLVFTGGVLAGGEVAIAAQVAGGKFMEIRVYIRA